jgi:hypothetical protein
MANIILETQGIKGGNAKTQNVGYLLACLRNNQDRIIIDDFEGFGDTYKQREMQLIEIIHNGNVLFSGDKYELYEILKAHNNDHKQ